MLPERDHIYFGPTKLLDLYRLILSVTIFDLLYN